MDYQEIISPTSKLRFKNGMGIAYDEILQPDYTLFSASQPVYICNLRTGHISYKKNLDLLLPNSDQISSIDQLNDLIHPDDKSKVHHIVRNTLAYLRDTGINPKAHLSISYRIRVGTDRYIQVNRISQMIKIPGEKPTFNFSVLICLPCLQPEKSVHFGWIENGVEDRDHKLFVEKNWSTIFSKREAEILHLIKSGKKYAEIAACLFISEKTVKKHIANARHKVLQENGVSLLDYFRKISM